MSTDNATVQEFPIFSPPFHFYRHLHKKVSMASAIEGLDEAALKKLILQVLAWRLGDIPDLTQQLMEQFSVSQFDALQILELLCPILDCVINNDPQSPKDVFQSAKGNISKETKELIANVGFSIKKRCIDFCTDHSPSLSRVLYHDWNTSMQVATESLGRIARPIASITMRIQPAASGTCILPPLKSVTMDLSKDMIDALASGFDRLQNQLVKIVQ